MRRFAVALAVLLVAAGGAGRRAAADDTDGDGDADLEIPGLDAATLRGDALVWEDALFHLEPWDGGMNVRFVVFARGRREELGRAIPVRIVGSSLRTFVEVEVSTEPSCGLRRVTIDPRVEALRFFVRRTDLAPVLARPFTATYSDGTSVRLAAGVPVLPNASGLYTVSLRGDRLRLPIPHAAVGYTYTRGATAEPERPTGAVVRVDRMVSARLGGDPFEIRSLWYVPKPTRPGDPQLVRLSSRCVDATFAIPAAALRPMPWSAPYRPPDLPDPDGGVVLRRIVRGAPLSLPSGREVAVGRDRAGSARTALPAARRRPVPTHLRRPPAPW